MNNDKPCMKDAKWAKKPVILRRKCIPELRTRLVAPLVGVIYLGAFGSMFWLDFIYACAVALLLPHLLVTLLA